MHQGRSVDSLFMSDENHMKAFLDMGLKTSLNTRTPPWGKTVPARLEGYDTEDDERTKLETEAGGIRLVSSSLENSDDLAGDSTPWFGRVEIKSNGIWGTVCDNGWRQDAAVGKRNAEAVCRSLELSGGKFVGVTGDKNLDIFSTNPGETPIHVVETKNCGVSDTFKECGGSLYKHDFSGSRPALGKCGLPPVDGAAWWEAK
jgi:hypothetical protein